MFDLPPALRENGLVLVGILFGIFLGQAGKSLWAVEIRGRHKRSIRSAFFARNGHHNHDHDHKDMGGEGKEGSEDDEWGTDEAVEEEEVMEDQDSGLEEAVQNGPEPIEQGPRINDEDHLFELPPPAPTIHLRHDDLRYTFRRKISSWGEYELNFWNRRHRDEHGSHLLKIEDVNRGFFTAIENARKMNIRDRDVVKCDSFIYFADTKQLSAKISSKSDVLVVGKLKRLISTKDALVNEDRPDLSLRSTPANLCFLEAYEPPPARPEHTAAEMVLITAGKADLSFSPARQDLMSVRIRELWGLRGWPPLVIESGLFIDDRSLSRRARWWFHSSNGRVRVILVVHLATLDGRPRRIQIEQWTCGDYSSGMRTTNRATIWVRPEHRWRTSPGGFTAESMYVDCEEKTGAQGDIGLCIPGEEVFGVEAGDGDTNRDLVLGEGDLKTL